MEVPRSKVMRWALAALALTGLLAAAPPALARTFTGVVHPLRDLTLSLGVGGVISKLPVEPGEHVEAGQTLLVLEDRLQNIEAKRRKAIWKDRAELETTKKRLAVVKSLYEDAQDLYQTGSISHDELRRLKMDYISTRGHLRQLRNRERREHLEYRAAVLRRELRRLRAPVAGVIVSSKFEVGEWVQPGEPLMRLVDASVGVLRVSVPADVARELGTGMRLPVMVKGLVSADPLEGKITFISPTADPASGLVELRIRFANPDLRVRPGVTAHIRWSAGQ